MPKRSAKKPASIEHESGVARFASTKSSPVDDLGRRVRQSRLLEPIAKRQWLALLPYLTPVDRARLEEILLAETSQTQP